MSALHSIKNLENFQTGTNGTVISWEGQGSRNSGNCRISEKRGIQPKIPEVQERLFPKISVPRKVGHFS